MVWFEIFNPQHLLRKHPIVRTFSVFVFVCCCFVCLFSEQQNSRWPPFRQNILHGLIMWQNKDSKRGHGYLERGGVISLPSLYRFVSIVRKSGNPRGIQLNQRWHLHSKFQRSCKGRSGVHGWEFSVRSVGDITVFVLCRNHVFLHGSITSEFSFSFVASLYLANSQEIKME